MNACSPIVTPHTTVAFAPIVTPRRTVVDSNSSWPFLIAARGM